METTVEKKQDRPDFVTDEHLEYLDALRESGATNMFGAGAYLQREFHELADRSKSSKALSYWMHTFGQRHPKSS